jgi:hypothetical protein
VDKCSDIITEHRERDSTARDNLVALDRTPLLDFLATHAEGRQVDAMTIGEIVTAHRAARARYFEKPPDRPKTPEVPADLRPPDQQNDIGTGMVISDVINGVGLPPRPPR